MGNFFLGADDPMAITRIAGGNATCRLPLGETLHRGETLTRGFVVGVAPAGQMRRAFLYYLERERAHPYRPFLHYNSWYDLSWQPLALNEGNCLEAIRLLGERFLKPHAVIMDAVVFDDGWDDPRTLWQFHGGFLHGFTPLAALSKQYHTRLGVWLSPFGGYGVPREERLRFGRAQGFEINAGGFSLAGSRYYAAFKRSCLEMIRSYGVNYFKFDGLAAGTYATGAAEYIRDTEAMRRLMVELRAEAPDLYINLTTGSWPSPFWLRYADSLWRQGGDMGRAGKGSMQQQWLNYRDQETYRNVVRKSPLFPLNSLMTQGVAYSRQGPAGDPTFNSTGFRDDVRAFFGSGTSLQELYIQPGRLTSEDWRVLAEAAKWSRANADVLVDTHWVGGDPGKSEVYGYASWSPRKGIVMLRNPDDRQRDFALDVGSAFELPARAARRYTLRSAWAEDGGKLPLIGEAGRPLDITLKPFEVVVLEATPESSHPTPMRKPIMNAMIRLSAACLAAGFAMAAEAGPPQRVATVKEYTRVFTTYPYSDPDPVASMTRFYPYFRFDGFSAKPVSKEWKVVELSNDYLQILILPEIGGKVWAAIEKSTGQSLVYFNHVVKFRDVGMRGPWTSGGMEANYGIMGHTPNCFSPVDYLVRRNPGGSASCTIGVLDLLTRSTWRLEINLPADQAVFTTRSLWHNGSGIDQPYYTWMNVGIKAAGDLQFVNPGTYYIGHDGKSFDWPIHRQNGRDLSWYEQNNFGSYKSYHVMGRYSEFFGGYWHQDDFGMARYSTYGEKPGRKIWIWGLSREGMIWENLLTDSDGQYVEVQSGRQFNQAAGESTLTPFKHRDFPPHATDIWTEYWMPVKGIKGFVSASPWGALNVTGEKTDRLVIRISPVRPLRDKLQVFDGDTLLHERALSLEPMKDVEEVVKLAAAPRQLRVSHRRRQAAIRGRRRRCPEPPQGGARRFRLGVCPGALSSR